MKCLFYLFFSSIFSISFCNAQEAIIWKKFTGEINNPEVPMLFDYSYAGYKLGETGIPDRFKHLKVYNVVDFGAVPNDSVSDQEAIQKAIHAAEKQEGGIVFFPSGTFLVNVNPTKTNPITINNSNIILKGSGLGTGGTTIQMKNHMLQRYPDEPEWKVSYMFVFSAKKSKGASTHITKNAQEGHVVIEVEHPNLFQKSKYIQLEMPYNLDAVSVALDGKTPRPHWENVIKKGVSFIENHEIESINGNQITIKDPLINNISTSENWQAHPYIPLENVGVEDIYFKANFNDNYVHHKDYIHDNAWSIIAMNTVAMSWVRRCRFSNITGAVSLNNSYASSILMLLVDGNGGHKLTNVTQSTRVLTGLISDATNNGQFHGAAMSHKTSGSVIWRVKTPKQGWDSHADIPKNNLVDLYEGSKMTNHGGNYINEPHHLGGLTLWNYKRVGEAEINYDFWSLSGKGIYWGFSAVNPIVVGLHGSETSFEKSNVGYLESLGAPVFPESLYEAQLKHRLGNLPEWVGESLKVWEEMEKK
jgi:hypothetical protein